jgi:hypothetical protein
MAKWKESQWDSDESDLESPAPNTAPLASTLATRPRHASKWLPKPLSELFGGVVKKKVHENGRNRRAMDEESRLMELLAQEEEDPIADDGALAGSGDEYEP